LVRHVVVLGVIAAIAFIWFSAGPILYMDTHLALDQSTYSERMGNMWDYVNGYSDVRHLTLWTYAGLVLAFSQVGIWIGGGDLNSTLAFTEVCLFLVNVVAVHIGLGRLIPFLLDRYKIDIKGWREQALIGALTLFYLFNVWSITIIWRPFWPYMFHYCFFPLLAYLVLRLISDESKVRPFVALLLISPFMVIGYNVPVSFAVDVVLLFTLVVALYGFGWKMVRRSVLAFAVMVLFFIPFIVTTIADSGALGRSISFVTGIGDIHALLLGNSPNLIQGAAGVGYPPFYYDSNMAWYKSMPFFFEPLYIAAFLVLVFLPLVISQRLRHNRLYLLLVFYYVAFVLLLCSVKDPYPLGDLMDQLLSTPLMSLLRSTYARFGEYLMVVSILLMAVGWAQVLMEMGRKGGSKRSMMIQRTVICGLALLLVIATLPGVSSALGQQAWKGYSATDPPIMTSIPSGYEWALSDLGSRSAQNNSDIVVFQYPTSYARNEWSQGPPYINLGSYGRTIVSPEHLDTLRNLLAHMVMNRTTDFEAPFTMVYAEDSTPIYGGDVELIRESILSIPGILGHVDWDKRSISGGKESIYLIQHDSSLGRFLTMADPSQLTTVNQETAGYWEGSLAMVDEQNVNYSGEIVERKYLEGLGTTLVVNVGDSLIREAMNGSQLHVFPVWLSLNDAKPGDKAYLGITLLGNSTSLNITLSAGNTLTGENSTSWTVPVDNQTTSMQLSLNGQNSTAVMQIYTGNLTQEIRLGNDDLARYRDGLRMVVENKTGSRLTFNHLQSNGTSLANWSVVEYTLNYERDLYSIEDVYSALQDKSYMVESVRSYERAGPAKWSVQLPDFNGQRLYFAEGYDSAWQAAVFKDGVLLRTVSPEVGPGGGMLFSLGETGNLTVTITFTTQSVFGDTVTVVLAAYAALWLMVGLYYLDRSKHIFDPIRESDIFKRRK
jgi:hypothetical protein